MTSDDKSDESKPLILPCLKGEDQCSENRDIADELSNVCDVNDQSEGQNANVKYIIDFIAEKNATGPSSSTSSSSLQSEIILN